MPTMQSYPASAVGDWVNPGDARVQEGLYAVEAISTYSDGGSIVPILPDQLLLSGFSFPGLPSGTVIRGIQVQVRAYRASGPVSCDLSVSLLKSGLITAGSSWYPLGTSASDASFGSASDLWGTTWSVADLASLQVVIDLNPSSSVASTGEVYVDSVIVTIYYADTTPDGYSFTSLTGQPLNTDVSSNVVTITGIDYPADVFFTTILGSSQWRKNGGAWQSGAGAVSNGDMVQVRHNTGATQLATVTSTLSVGGVQASFSTTTAGLDSTPDAFGFGSVANVDPSTLQTSGAVTVAGINTTAAVSITSGEYNKNGEGWTSAAGTCVQGDSFQVRGTANASFGGGTTVTLTVGGVAGTFSITTRTADTAPDPFTFTDLSSQVASATVTSNAITVSGTESPASVSTSNTGGSTYQYKVNAGSFGAAPATLSNGDTLQLRMTLPASGSASMSVTIGGVSDTWTATVATGDTVPDAFLFVDEPQAGPSQVVESNVITFTGMDSASTLTFATTGTGTAHQYRKNGGAWTSLASVSMTGGDTLQVRLTAPGTVGAAAAITATLSGVSDSFNVTVTAADSTPNAITFVSLSGLDPLTVAESNAITLSGLNVPAAVSVAGGEYSKNGAAWSTADTTAVKGDTFKLRVTTSAQYSISSVATLTVGSVPGTFTATNRAPDSSTQYVVTFRESIYGNPF